VSELQISDFGLVQIKNKWKQKNHLKKEIFTNWNIICTATIKSSEDDDFTESWWRKNIFSFEKLIKEFNACDRECDEIQRSWEFFCLFKKNTRKKFVYQERIMTHEIVVQIFWARLRPEIFVWIYKFSNDFCERASEKKWGKINE
jgi:hypothetical protein